MAAYWTIGSILFLLIAGSLTFRLNARNVPEAIGRALGYLTTLAVVCVLLLTIPPLFIQYFPSVLESWWSPLLVQLTGDTQTISQDVADVTQDLIAQARRGAPAKASFSVYGTPGFSTVDAIAGDGTYTVQPGDTLGEIADRVDSTVQAIAEANSITNLDTLEVGQILVIPPLESLPVTEPTIEPTLESVDSTVAVTATDQLPPSISPTVTPLPSPTPQPTPDPFSQIEAELAGLRVTGQRAEALALINGVLKSSPGNLQALREQAEIEQATEQLQIWRGLERAGENQAEEVQAALNGYTFEIVDQTRIPLFSLRKSGTVWGGDETSTLRVLTPGYLFGERLTLLRGHTFLITSQNDEIGTQFSVGE